jgi:processive 1,2-diacylglycerol beta-glucosyltransferase
MNILILTVSAGAGHSMAAEAIKNKIKKRFPQSRTVIIDTYKYVNPLVDKLIIGGYLKTIKKTPKVYGKLYALSEPRGSKFYFGRTVNKLLAIRLKRLINDFSPSVIVCTNFIPLQILAALNKRKPLNIPTLSVITDFTSHSYWLHEYVTAYVVAHDFMKYELIKKGIPENIIYPTGIPISASFLHKKDKTRLLKELRLEKKPTILIMGGILGFGEVKKAFLSLLNYKGDIQIVVITGTNTALKHQLEKCSFNSDKKIKVVGYTNRVADYMEVSDLIITKPAE